MALTCVAIQLGIEGVLHLELKLSSRLWAVTVLSQILCILASNN